MQCIHCLKTAHEEQNRKQQNVAQHWRSKLINPFSRLHNKQISWQQTQNSILANLMYYLNTAIRGGLKYEYNSILFY